MLRSLELPIFSELVPARSILIAGAGGGFDVFSGLPLYFALKERGKEVHLANLTFSNLPPGTAGRQVTPECVEVTADSEGSKHYFPEKHLARWFRDHGHGEVPIYAFHRVGPKPVAEAYRTLQAELGFDTVILVDGGTDSLMRGDEEGLGTPVEDMTSISAASQLDTALIPRRFLVCLGFGVDSFHGVCHAHVLEAVAELIRLGGYLGAFSLTGDMPAVRQYSEAINYVLSQTSTRSSIVCTSILSALEGQFGDFHRTDRTWGSDLFINPLMSLYWGFRLEVVAQRVQYLQGMRELSGFAEVERYIRQFQASLPSLRGHQTLPM